MQISVKNTPDDIFINTVCLSHNSASPLNTELFRCYRCGTGLNQVQGYISSISAGYNPSDDVAIITRCHECHENYTFQTREAKSLRITSLILSSRKIISTFHCVICKSPLLQYNAQMIRLLPDFKEIDLPDAFPCFNPVCKAQYLLREIVEPDVVQ